MNPIAVLPEPMVLALHALGELGRDPSKCLSTHDIAIILGTTEPHLSKALQKLNRCGFIRSYRGPGGGYKLDCVPENVKLAPLFEQIGGPFIPKGNDLESCEGKHCFIGQMMNELTFAFLRYLKSRTVADFLKYYINSIPVSIEISVVTPSLGQKHPNFSHLHKKSVSKKGTKKK